MHQTVTPTSAASLGGTVARVSPGSDGARAGLRTGDRILAVNGHAIRDVIGYQFYKDDAPVELLVERGDERFTLRFEDGEQLGIEFADATFDGIRRCANRCLFCFVDQLPPSLRPSLYVKDDDYRCSMIHGNFITLTNLRESDWERLAEQRLSPLHISIHATDPSVRRFLLGNPSAPEVLPQLRRLASLGIKMHAQIVLCPDVNDGEVLARTVADLAELHPGVGTVGIVPVSLAQERQGLRPVEADDAHRLVRSVADWQRGYRRRLGVGFVHLADEFYLTCGHRLPSARAYDGFEQYENGIGMVRTLQDGWSRLRVRLAGRAELSFRQLTVVCGRLIAPVLSAALGELASITGWRIDIVPAENRLFGNSVTVSGLLGGNDVLAVLRGHTLGDLLVLPRTMLDGAGARTLDDLTPSDLESALGVPVRFAASFKELVDAAAILFNDDVADDVARNASCSGGSVLV